MREKCFSESIFWKLHQNLYEQLGPKVWTHGGMPFYLTSSPFLLKRYSDLIERQLMFWWQSNRISIEEPVYIFDMGCGPGRGGYTTLLLLEKISACSPFSLKYVFVDVSQKVIQFLLDHADLHPFFNSGLADVAHFDARKDQEMKLCCSGQILGKHFLRNPLCLIANYFFDSLPQDVFESENGLLYQVNTTFVPDPLHDSSLIDALRKTPLQTERGPVLCPEKYYTKAHWIKTLRELSLYDWTTDFGVPVGAFEALDNVLSWAPQGYLLLASDQGGASLENLCAIGGHKASAIAMGSISVNYLALRHYFEVQRKNVTIAESENYDPELVTMIALDQGDIISMPALFKNLFCDIHIVDFWKLTNNLIEHAPISLENVGLLLRCSQYDPCIFFFYFPHVRQLLNQATDIEKRVWIHHLLRIAKQFFPVSQKDQQLLGDIGVLLFDLGAFEESLQILIRVLSLDGGAFHTENNIKLCLKKMGKIGEFENIKATILKNKVL